MNSDFFTRKDLFYSHYVFKGAKLAKFIRYEAGWKVCLFSFTKFTENWWNNCVFEDTEEHRRCSGKCTGFQFMYVEKNLFYYKEILHFATLRSEWHGSVFYLRLGIWIIFETQRFFILIMFLREQSWRNSLAKKRGGNWYGMRYEMRVTRCEYFYHKVHWDGVKWLCFWAHWGTSEMLWDVH